MKLHADVVKSAAATKTLVLLHGILGQGNNLRGLARQFIEGSPGWQAVLMDLRAHGNSQSSPADADTVQNCARDVVETLTTLLGKGEVAAVVGHSFGGKVALALTQHAPHIMTLDSAPGARPDARGSESTEEVIELLHSLRGPWATRDAFIAELTAKGQSKPIAQWLAMNAERREDGFHFRLDMKRIDTLIDDYLNVDLWPAVEQAREGQHIHLVIASRSRVYDHEDRVRAQTLETGGANVTVDLIDAGHWIHVDAPSQVLEVMRRRLT